MTFVFSMISVIALLLTLAKFITKRVRFKRFNLQKADKVLGKIHGKLAYVLIAVVIVHMVYSLSVFESRPIGIYLLGALMIICMSIAGLSYRFRKVLGKKWIVVHRAAALSICIVLAGHVGLLLHSMISYQTKVSNIVIEGMDISKVPDGTYIGEYDVQYIYAKVQVNVKDGKITTIDILEHRNERGTPAEVILHEVVEKQKTDIDAVSGATNSSKVLERAVENALK